MNGSISIGRNKFDTTIHTVSILRIKSFYERRKYSDIAIPFGKYNGARIKDIVISNTKLADNPLKVKGDKFTLTCLAFYQSDTLIGPQFTYHYW